MSTGFDFFYGRLIVEPPPMPSEAELFEQWVAFGDGWTYEEYLNAYLATRSAR